MKLKPWIQSMLHIGCVALLLLQGHRIQKLLMTVAEDGRKRTEWTVLTTCLGHPTCPRRNHVDI
jgi:hypothetical protein